MPGESVGAPYLDSMIDDELRLDLNDGQFLVRRFSSPPAVPHVMIGSRARLSRYDK